MKTIEQKAKAYDEALERARMINNGEDVDIEAGTTTCEYIFPELRESEDEKIRKQLITAFKSLNTIRVWAGIERKVIIDWLEKQGQKSTELHKEDEQNLNACLGYIPDEFLKGWLTDVIHAKDKKVDWCEEDESMYTRTLGILGKCYMGELPTKVEEELKWFKSIKQKICG